LSGLQAGFVSHGFDSATAMKKAMAALDATVRRQAYVMAFNDCFLAVGVALVGASCLILLCKKVGAGSGPSEAH
jgi:DHA2 family multidrug resistance protein